MIFAMTPKQTEFWKVGRELRARHISFSFETILPGAEIPAHPPAFCGRRPRCANIDRNRSLLRRFLAHAKARRREVGKTWFSFAIFAPSRENRLKRPWVVVLWTLVFGLAAHDGVGTINLVAAAAL